MNVKAILFPTDFSHTGDAALKFAESLARDTGAILHIVHVEEPPMVYGTGGMYTGMPDPDAGHLKALLEKVVPSDKSIRYVHHMMDGNPADAICRFAKDEDIDLIVMGTHGRTSMMRLLMGSVAEAVVRRVPCPVLTYKQPDDAVKCGAS